MEVHLPSIVHGDPPHEWRLQCSQAPITRAPQGQQQGLPALLDYCASTGIVEETAVVWTALPTDHAAVYAKVRLKAKEHVKFRRGSWRCSDNEAATKWAAARFENVSVTSAAQFAAEVAELQTRFEDKSTCAERRRKR